MPANVQVGEVIWGDQDDRGRFRTAADSKDIYEDYVVENNYFKEGSLYALGCASPAGFRGFQTAFVQLSAPILYWVADWTAAMWNRPPQIPDPRLLGRAVLRTIGATARGTGRASWVLLDESIKARNIIYAADGETAFYRISGTYVYGCLNPSEVLADDVVIPRPVWAMDPLNGRDVTRDRLVQGIINKF